MTKTPTPGRKKPTQVVSTDKDGLLKGQQQRLEDFLTLKNLEIKIKKGEFVCIIGDVGAGKSSLLNAIIGELMYTTPEFYEKNSQERMNDSLIENLTAHGNEEIPWEKAPIVIS